MKSHRIFSDLGPCLITSGQSLDQWIQSQQQKKHIVITDDNLFNLYADLFQNTPTIKIGLGEKIKSLRTLEKIYHELMEMEADRSTVISGIGGGIVCDLTGFAASTYMRGLRFNLVPTSLLAQVDASIGGKNGANLQGFKNMIGTFAQPDQVLIDFNLLKTLPRVEMASGAAEIVKHALISSLSFFEYIEKYHLGIFSFEMEVLERVVLESIRIKAAIVERDARESGQRRILNFGHTFGHAIEKIYGLSHGEAVSLGMAIAVYISKRKKMLDEKDSRGILNLLERMNLPTQMILDKEPLLRTLKGDKKRQADQIHFVLLAGIGKPTVETLSFQELEEHIDDLCQH